jgi:hypothetical protein
MEIFINETGIDVTLENEHTLGDVLNAIEQSCAQGNATIVDIEVDGKPVNADDIDSESHKAIEDIQVLKLRTVSADDIRDSLRDMGEDFLGLAQDFCNIPSWLQSGKREDAYKTIQNLANIIDAFCRVTTLSALFPEQFAVMRIGGKTPNDFFTDFSPILNDFCKALENNDIVMIGDLAEYEIAPRLSDIAAITEDTL